MLVVSRKENESIRIEPVDGVDPALTLREAFAGGPIIVRLQHVGHRRVRLVIEAPPALKIMRAEALEPSAERPSSLATDDANPAVPHRSGRTRTAN